MNELLVEWTLLREKNYLQNCIDLQLESKFCQQFTTSYGRIDFAHKIKNDGYLITELETIIDSKAKLLYCIEQTKQYQNIRFVEDAKHTTAVLIAKQTKDFYKNELFKFCSDYNVKYYDYDLEIVAKLYKDEIEKSLINVGVPLSKPVAMNLTSLSSINRFILPFFLKNTNKLKIEDFSDYFILTKSKRSNSTFNVIYYGANYFDLAVKKGNYYILTDLGIRFKENINLNQLTEDLKRIDLSLEQKRILIESLLNGNFYEKKSKINIYYFLKFISLTDGEWIPRGRKFDSMEKFTFVNNFLKMNYTQGTVANWIQFTCNQSEELELVEKIKTTGFYDSVRMTTFGSRVLSFLDFDIQHKRERVQIPLQL